VGSNGSPINSEDTVAVLSGCPGPWPAIIEIVGQGYVATESFLRRSVRGSHDFPPAIVVLGDHVEAAGTPTPR